MQPGRGLCGFSRLPVGLPALQQGRQLRRVHSLWDFQVLVRCRQGKEGERSHVG